GLGRPVDPLHQRTAAELRRQQGLEDDLPLRLVAGMRGTAAAADAEAVGLVADVAERPRRGVVARAHRAEPHVAAGPRAAGADRPAIRQPAIGSARPGADVRGAAAGVVVRLERRMLTRRLTPPADVGD